MDRFSQYAVVASNMAAGQVSIYLGDKGPNTNVCTACVSGTHSTGDALKIIQRGDADIMVAGGSEAPITALSFYGFCNMKAMSTRNDEQKTSSRPFDKDGDGTTKSMIMVLEAVVCAMSIYDKFIPPTTNVQNLDEELDLDYVLYKGREKEVRYSMSNSLGFGGHNATLVFNKY